MPGENKNVFMHTGDWSDETRNHPAIKWIEQYTYAFDENNSQPEPASDWYTDDISFRKPDGTEVQGIDKVVAEAAEVHGPFTKFIHVPYWLSCWETSDGWEMIGKADLYANMQGQPTADEKTVTSRGEQWQVSLPAWFHFWYTKSPESKHGILIQRCEMMTDTMPAVQILTKRGVMKM